jgi:hypothetical protein
MFVHFFYREINNGILEATSFRGWFKSNRPLFGVATAASTMSKPAIRPGRQARWVTPKGVQREVVGSRKAPG